jgi:hypothetical protein
MKIKTYAKVTEHVKVECDTVTVLEAIKEDLKIEVNINKLAKTFNTYPFNQGNRTPNDRVIESEKERKVTINKLEYDHRGNEVISLDAEFWFAPREWEAFKALRTLITYYRDKGALE